VSQFFLKIAIISVTTLNAGAIKPGRRMQFAATCTLSASGGIVPEADSYILHTLREKLESQTDGTVNNMKPPIPARYRHHLFSQLTNAVPQQAAHVLYPPQPGTPIAPTPISIKPSERYTCLVCSWQNGRQE
jgi:hypothetical protein